MIRAYYIGKKSMSTGAVRFTFEVEEGDAEAADRTMGMPSAGKTKLFDITPFVDAPSPFYQTEPNPLIETKLMKCLAAGEQIPTFLKEKGE